MSTIVGLPSTGPGSEKANFIISLEAFRLLNRLEHDSHLVVVTHKAPHEVQRQCLLHVLLKVMEGVLSHVRKVKACVLVAQYEVRLFLRVLRRQQNHATKQTCESRALKLLSKFAQATNESTRPCLTSFKMQTRALKLSQNLAQGQEKSARPRYII